jgi:hypothetical protein
MGENMDYLDKYENLLKILTEKVDLESKGESDSGHFLKDDFEKFFVRGNKTAGTRIRKFMQLLRRAAEDVRGDVQDYKKGL